MPRERPDAARLWDMLESARIASEIVRGRGFDEVMGDHIVRAALERYIEILGEAASRVSPACREANPDVPWEKIVVTRHRFVHEYYGLDPVIVWRIATVRVAALLPVLESMGLSPQE